MKYCTYCGNGMDDTAAFCPNCGARVEAPAFSASAATTPPPDTKDYTESKGILILSFLFSLVGLILYLMWHETQPGKANSALKGLLIKVCLGVPLLGIILYFVWKDEKPDFAKISLISGILAFILPVVFFVLYFVFVIALAAATSGVNFAALSLPVALMLL